MPKLTIKNKSATLLSLAIGQVGPGAKRDFDITSARMENLQPKLALLRDRGQVEFWTDADLKATLNDDDGLRQKAAEVDELRQKASEINSLRKEWARTLGVANEELLEVRKVKDLWNARAQELKLKLKKVDVWLQRASEVDDLLGKAQEVEALLSRAEDVHCLWERTDEINQVLGQAKVVESLRDEVEDIRALHKTLSERVETPLSEVVRRQSDRVITCSQRADQQVQDMSLTLPSTGSWIVSFEAVIHSKIPASGFIVLVLNGVETTKRPTGELGPEGCNSSLFMTEPCEATEGTTVEVMWRSSKGSMRMTTRRLTAMKVSHCDT